MAYISISNNLNQLVPEDGSVIVDLKYDLAEDSSVNVYYRYVLDGSQVEIGSVTHAYQTSGTQTFSEDYSGSSTFDWEANTLTISRDSDIEGLELYITSIQYHIYPHPFAENADGNRVQVVERDKVVMFPDYNNEIEGEEVDLGTVTAPAIGTHTFSIPQSGWIKIRLEVAPTADQIIVAFNARTRGSAVVARSFYTGENTLYWETPLFPVMKGEPVAVWVAPVDTGSIEPKIKPVFFPMRYI